MQKTFPVNIPLINMLAMFMLYCPVQAKTYYVADNGSDNNPATRTQPFQTISKAAEAAQPGDTVFVMEGVYRERVSPPREGTATQPIVYMGEPGKRVFIKGSDVYESKWEKISENIFAANLNRMQFTDDCYLDSPNPFKVTTASTPYGRDGRAEGKDESIAYTLGQIFVESIPYLQTPLEKEMREQPGSWWYDPNTNKALVHFKPEHSTQSFVEITTRRRIFAPHTLALGHIHVIGFIMEHCGNQFPRDFFKQRTNAQAGALDIRSGHHWLIKNNVVRYASGIGVNCGQRSNNNERTDPDAARHKAVANRIENNYLINNGCNGIVAASSQDMVVTGNVVMYNNTHRYIGRDRYESGGLKFHDIKNALIARNLVANNYSFGIWLDNKYPQTRVCNNLIVNNQKGIKVEMGEYGFGAVLIDHNVLMDNLENQYYSHDASGVLLVNNLIAGTRSDYKTDDNEDVKTGELFGQGVYVRQITSRTRSDNNAFYNNIICNNDYTYNVLYPIGKGGEQRFLGNLYDRGNVERILCINNMTQPSSTENDFKQMITDDLEGNATEEMFGSLAIFNGHKSLQAFFNLQEWQKFWSAHTRHNDSDALAMAGLHAKYHPEDLSVSLTLPKKIKPVDNTRWTEEYLHTYPSLAEKTSLPGPFENLRTGTHTYYPYKGMPPVRSDELPGADVFTAK
jgi:hypothetical protein